VLCVRIGLPKANMLIVPPSTHRRDIVGPNLMSSLHFLLDEQRARYVSGRSGSPMSSCGPKQTSTTKKFEGEFTRLLPKF
jgi:hypothetical protein